MASIIDKIQPGCSFWTNKNENIDHRGKGRRKRNIQEVAGSSYQNDENTNIVNKGKQPCTIPEEPGGSSRDSPTPTKFCYTSNRVKTILGKYEEHILDFCRTRLNTNLQEIEDFINKEANKLKQTLDTGPKTCNVQENEIPNNQPKRTSDASTQTSDTSKIDLLQDQLPPSFKPIVSVEKLPQAVIEEYLKGNRLAERTSNKPPKKIKNKRNEDPEEVPDDDYTFEPIPDCPSCKDVVNLKIRVKKSLTSLEENASSLVENSSLNPEANEEMEPEFENSEFIPDPWCRTCTLVVNLKKAFEKTSSVMGLEPSAHMYIYIITKMISILKKMLKYEISRIDFLRKSSKYPIPQHPLLPKDADQDESILNESASNSLPLETPSPTLLTLKQAEVKWYTLARFAQKSLALKKPSTKKMSPRYLGSNVLAPNQGCVKKLVLKKSVPKPQALKQKSPGNLIMNVPYQKQEALKKSVPKPRALKQRNTGNLVTNVSTSLKQQALKKYAPKTKALKQKHPGNLVMNVSSLKQGVLKKSAPKPPALKQRNQGNLVTNVSSLKQETLKKSASKPPALKQRNQGNLVMNVSSLKHEVLKKTASKRQALKQRNSGNLITNVSSLKQEALKKIYSNPQSLKQINSGNLVTNVSRPKQGELKKSALMPPACAIKSTKFREIKKKTTRFSPISARTRQRLVI